MCEREFIIEESRNFITSAYPDAEFAKEVLLTEDGRFVQAFDYFCNSRDQKSPNYIKEMNELLKPFYHFSPNTIYSAFYMLEQINNERIAESISSNRPR